MIITVTMNPAIDKTVDIGKLDAGGLNRIQHVELDAGGKGINVSRNLQMLGCETIAMGFVAGNAGTAIEQMLSEQKIRTDFVRVNGETRTNTKVVENSGRVTELNEPGPVITDLQMEELLSRLETYADPDTMIVLSGSIPQGISKDIYRLITERMHAKGASVLMDADGELFSQALQAGPDIIKPNHLELEAYMNQTGLEDIRELFQLGITEIVISKGAEGAEFVKKNQKAVCRALSVKTHSTVGAGDAMVAALAYGWEKDLSFTDTAKLAMAVSAGAVTTVGTKPPSRKLVDELLAQVTIV